MRYTDKQESSSIADHISARLQLRNFLLSRPYTVILIAALIYNLLCKFYWSRYLDLHHQYYKWISSDISVLLFIEAGFAMICFRWPKRSVIRPVSFISALICTWSVMNAGWLIRNGHQILPYNLLPIFRDPANGFRIIGGNFETRPYAAAILMTPAVTLFIYFCYTLIKTRKPNYNHRRFKLRIIATVLVAFIAGTAYFLISREKYDNPTSAEMRHNCQLSGVVSIFRSSRQKREIIQISSRTIPSFDQINISHNSKNQNYNVVIIVLEGVQYRLTSLADSKTDLTPYLAVLAKQGAYFPEARCVLTHTTKALFGLLTGLTPSVSQDIAEAVPVEKPYASLATILKSKLNYRTAFFQSAKGNFECRPGLVHNLGFDKFWSRDNCKDPNAFVGYLGCDEFALLNPITDWIKEANSPFFVTVLCSVTHDPYEVPAWFEEPEKELYDRYVQTINYTDSFISAFDAGLINLNLKENTIFCIIGDHGEAFGEHNQFGHERIVYEEALRIPFVIRAPKLIEPNTVVTGPVSSIDLTPTLLTLLGFKTISAGFDGEDALNSNLKNRRIYFSGWLNQSSAGFIENNRKYLYDPVLKTTAFYDLSIDPQETTQIILQEKVPDIEKQITDWRSKSIFRIHQSRFGRKTLFDNWFCRWTERISSAKYDKENGN